jgi:hypothetical protein
MPIEFVPKQIRSGINNFCVFQQTLNIQSTIALAPVTENTCEGLGMFL